MTNIQDIMDMDLLEKHIQNGIIVQKKHPTKDLFLYTYSHKCQIEWLWDKVTIQCRGLITDGVGTIVARPFIKFFTPTQYRDLRSSVWNLFGRKYKQLFNGSFTVTEKMDGSLGILYHDGDEWAIATKGSFESEQAIKATKILREKYPQIWPNDSLTYLFEIIYPENQIVVNYNGVEDLVLIGVVDTDTGLDIPFNQQPAGDCASNLYNITPVALSYSFNSFDDILKIQKENKEGFVVNFGGFRVKVKFAEYLRLHKIMSNFSPKKVWECLYHNESMEYLLNDVPEVFSEQVRDILDDFQTRYNKIEVEVAEFLYRNDWGRIEGPNRKQLALRAENWKYRNIVFLRIDKKDEWKAIWKLVWKEYEEGV